MIVILTAIEAIEWVIRILGVYVLIDSAEKLYSFREFRNHGLFSWHLLRSNQFFASRPAAIRRWLDRIFVFHNWIFLLLLRGLAGLWLLYMPQNQLITSGSLLIVFIVGSLMNFRHTPYGAETENRFALVLCGALVLRSIAPTELVTVICLWFIALQTCVSYVTAGITKWLNPDWRKGYGVLHVIGSPDLVPLQGIKFFFKRHQRLGKVLAWATIGIECLFPLVLAGPPFLWILLGWGLLFHLSIAIWLRLGKFFWVWAATYPAIIFVAQW